MQTAASRIRAGAQADRLSSWKELAAYLGCSVATAQRWERNEALPVHRHRHAKLGSIIASKSEVDRWAIQRGHPAAAGRSLRPALAVLPFDNLTGDPNQEHFADGFTEELITELGRRYSDSMALIARTSVMRYKGTHTGIDHIGRELRVGYILEGSLRRLGSRLRISAQLIETARQTHVWAESFEAELSDLFAVQQGIACQAAAKIGIQLVGPEQSVALQFADPETHDLYLKGRFHLFKLTRDGFGAALHYFQLALERDPNCAPAYAGIAAVWHIRGDSGLVPPSEALPHAKAAALRGMELCSDSALIRAVYGYLLFSYDWDFPGALREARLAVTLNSSDVDAHLLLWDCLAALRRFEEAEPQILTCLKLDPYNPFFQCFYGWQLLFTGRLDEAVRQLRKTVAIQPDLTAARLGLWGAYFRKAMHAEAVREACRFFLLRGQSEIAGALRADYRRSGYPKAMKNAADALAAHAGAEYIGALRVARLYAHANDRERAFHWLERAVDERTPALAHLAIGWDWVQLREEARFKAILRRICPPVR